jgi:hypothetical protein
MVEALRRGDRRHDSHPGAILFSTKAARALSEMTDKAARDSAKCQSSGAALGSQAYKKCRALLEDKMSIGNDVPPDRSYASTRNR